ncbi:uncharacterized protein LOC105781379 [Gossypium raimondii]|uniref:uncharacterized protein LOC105781379 n=1 Tax=Gossypium raimondii TaxID=29730 RepID=UPI00063AEE31|nr:uncharacterized protein LOC105781379 [Gossypium raimondii]
MHFQELGKQVSKLALMVSHLESQGKLPSQTKPIPQHNSSTMTLRSGKVLESESSMSRAHDAGSDKKKLDTEALVESAPQKSFAETGVIIQLADRSVVHSEGVLEDVLVKVNELIFQAEFYIIDIEDDNSTNLSNILLGRPFLSTAQTKIEVRGGILTMEFDGKVDELRTVLRKSLDFDAMEELEEWITFEEFVCEPVAHMEAPQLRKNPGSSGTGGSKEDEVYVFIWRVRLQTDVV